MWKNTQMNFHLRANRVQPSHTRFAFVANCGSWLKQNNWNELEICFVHHRPPRYGGRAHFFSNSNPHRPISLWSESSRLMLLCLLFYLKCFSNGSACHAVRFYTHIFTIYAWALPLQFYLLYQFFAMTHTHTHIVIVSSFDAARLPLFVDWHTYSNTTIFQATTKFALTNNKPQLRAAVTLICIPLHQICSPRSNPDIGLSGIRQRIERY